MNVHFCPHCGRLNLEGFLYCPYCGEAVSAGPGLEEALESPFRRLEESLRSISQLDETVASDAQALEHFERLASSLDAIDRDMALILDEFAAEKPTASS
jgi:uncharacterized Zn finger protein (UPF0148 family)